MEDTNGLSVIDTETGAGGCDEVTGRSAECEKSKDRNSDWCCTSTGRSAKKDDDDT